MMKERAWFLGTTACTRATPSLMPCGDTAAAGDPPDHPSPARGPPRGCPHLHKEGFELAQVLEDVGGAGVQLGQPAGGALRRQPGGVGLLGAQDAHQKGVGPPKRGRFGGCRALGYLEQLAGRLPEVADDALQSLALRLIRDGVQVHGPCGGTRSRSGWGQTPGGCPPSPCPTPHPHRCSSRRR